MSKQWHGWAGKVLWVDLSSKSYQTTELPAELAYGYLGQSGVNARLLYDLAPQGMDPFDPKAPLIFGVGPLSGTLAPCSGRFTVTAKSPLTGIFGDSNCGGHWGPELKQAGYDHIIITGQAEHPVYLWLDNDRVTIRDARHLWGKDTWSTDEAIKKELGDNTIQIACIGPAGENRVRFAAIICNLARAAARTGPGAVMGSKNLKAIAVRGNMGTSVAKPAQFREAVARAVEAIRNDPLYEVASTFGTTAITGLAQMLGFLPTRNFQQSTFEEGENLRGEVLLENYITKRKGCFNCPVSCSRFYKVSSGDYAGTLGEGPEYETISAFGSKCGNGNMESILFANTLCNKLGLDTISTGNAVAWAMEGYQRGIIKDSDTGLNQPLHWGSHKLIIELINKIAHREGFGGLLAEGALRAAKKMGGVELVVHSKGMDYPAVDVRGTKGMALSFAVSPRGGDHLKGLPMYEVGPEIYAKDIKELLGINVTPNYWMKYETKPQLMYWHENWHCVVDSLGLCKLEGIAMKPLLPVHFRDLLAFATGWDVDVLELELIGERIWNLERLFNIREGLRRHDDMPPARMFEPIGSGPAEGESLDFARYNQMLDEYYSLRGWDKAGVPTGKKLRELGLHYEGKN
ncbi:aldehyde ferredoxin oxidoreductase family protein [Desulfallas thermosapovorans]|uniref:Aldehyde:ferredoxin oxidoreductase n=1 Tax=Desulfallas thermosapovorans DSM 6562 TaxID=1121431 RepID=A0A5S4ZRI3_9FIRM|nr:aldehyde ferredoxin oxidoreductase family protein [Desulfallas thermosapovorans]TYO95337.1 aldehyde:ferredoxin oxidoreductase [Desulfallas thermosapovorans DSM 6562]